MGGFRFSGAEQSNLPGFPFWCKLSPLIIVDPSTPTAQAKVDDTSKALRIAPYAVGSNAPLCLPDRGALVPGVQQTTPGMGVDYKIARLLRSSSDGSARTDSDDSVFLYDSREGAAVDTNKWIQTLTTMTITQAAGVVTFNAGASVATTVGAQQVSHRQIPYATRMSTTYRTRHKPGAHFTNNLIEMGFGAPASVTGASIGTGACWRKDGTGQWIPVVSFAGSEQLGVGISNATFLASVATTEFAIFSVFLEETRATFRIQTSLGVVVNEQTVDFPAVNFFAVTHNSTFERTYNSAGTGTAVQPQWGSTIVMGLDGFSGRSWEQSMVGQNYGTLSSPTAYTQLANYANSAAPASATLSNTAAGYATLGGQWQFAAVGGAETDYALFGFTNPTPYVLMVRRVKIASFNMVVAVATTVTGLQWGLAFNSSAISLATGAPYTPMRKAIGYQYFLTAAAVGQGSSPGDVEWTGLEPVFPGRFFVVILKMPTATATATEIIRGTCDVEGYFE